jgi:hypothetical protein
MEYIGAGSVVGAFLMHIAYRVPAYMTAREVCMIGEG